MTLAQVATLVGGTTVSELGEVIRVSSFAEAGADSIVFAADENAEARALASLAGCILVPATSEAVDPRLVRVTDPKYAFALCARALAAPWSEPLIHPTATVHSSAKIGAGTRIDAGVVIEQDVMIGADAWIGSRVTVYEGVRIGARVVVQAGAVLGSRGFGYVRNAATGEYVLFPQQGSLAIEDDVEIGANTTIDRGALGETRIGRGTKIDNLVHIGHNCRIGNGVIIAAQVGISGSCVIGDGAILAGQVGLGDHVTIGPGVVLGGASGVFPHKEIEGPGEMFMGVPAEPLRKYLKTLAKLRRL